MIDTLGETWADVLVLLKEVGEAAQESVNSPETPENLTNFNRGILYLEREIRALPYRKAPAIEGRKA
jgi:hypothetical protein